MASRRKEEPSASSLIRDYSQVKLPVELGSTGLKQLLQCYHQGTEEIKGILMHECELVIECRVCRSLYRGLPNFISHKRHFCNRKHLSSDSSTYVTDNEAKYVIDAGVNSHGYAVLETEVNKTKQSKINPTSSCKNAERAKQHFNQVKENNEPKNFVSHIYSQDSSLGNDQRQPSSKGGPKQKQEIEKSKKAGGSVAKGAQEELQLNGACSKPCSESVVTMHQFYRHHKLIHDRTHCCLRCRIKFTSNKKLLRHMNCCHLKRQQFHQCGKCSKVYLGTEGYVQHMTSDHSLTSTDAKNITSEPTVHKFIIDNCLIFDIPLFKRKSEQSNSKDGTASSSADNLLSPAEKKHKRILKLEKEILKCLDKFLVNFAHKKFKCRQHDKTFKSFASLKTHVVFKHMLPVITCPECDESFKREEYNSSCFEEFVKHIESVHYVRKSDIPEMKRDLMERLLSTHHAFEESDDQNEGPMTSEVVVVSDKTNLRSSRRSAVSQFLGENGQASSTIFSLNDLPCLWCSMTFLKMNRVTAHMKLQHPDKWSQERADEIRRQVHANYEQKKLQMFTEWSSGRSCKPLPVSLSNKDAEMEEEYDETDIDMLNSSSRRKQRTPAKFQLPDAKTTQGKKMLSHPLKSGFCLHRCSKCNKSFGKEKSLVLHQRSCSENNAEQLDTFESDLAANSSDGPHETHADVSSVNVASKYTRFTGKTLEIKVQLVKKSNAFLATPEKRFVHAAGVDGQCSTRPAPIGYSAEICDPTENEDAEAGCPSPGKRKHRERYHESVQRASKRFDHSSKPNAILPVPLKKSKAICSSNVKMDTEAGFISQTEAHIPTCSTPKKTTQKTEGSPPITTSNAQSCESNVLFSSDMKTCLWCSYAEYHCYSLLTHMRQKHTDKWNPSKIDQYKQQILANQKRHMTEVFDINRSRTERKCREGSNQTSKYM